MRRNNNLQCSGSRRPFGGGKWTQTAAQQQNERRQRIWVGMFTENRRILEQIGRTREEVAPMLSVIASAWVMAISSIWGGSPSRISFEYSSVSSHKWHPGFYVSVNGCKSARIGATSPHAHSPHTTRSPNSLSGCISMRRRALIIFGLPPTPRYRKAAALSSNEL